ncbi:hypothetical protein BJY52DRAFT_154437 [Lactarius psammicola]|nr:hypothetical protein BJY52DRAFT_154437 [Lactarius psammicola]
MGYQVLSHFSVPPLPGTVSALYPRCAAARGGPHRSPQLPLRAAPSLPPFVDISPALVSSPRPACPLYELPTTTCRCGRHRHRHILLCLSCSSWLSRTSGASPPPPVHSCPHLAHALCTHVHLHLTPSLPLSSLSAFVLAFSAPLPSPCRRMRGVTLTSLPYEL